MSTDSNNANGNGGPPPTVQPPLTPMDRETMSESTSTTRTTTNAAAAPVITEQVTPPVAAQTQQAPASVSVTADTNTDTPKEEGTGTTATSNPPSVLQNPDSSEHKTTETEIPANTAHPITKDIKEKRLTPPPLEPTSAEAQQPPPTQSNASTTSSSIPPSSSSNNNNKTERRLPPNSGIMRPKIMNTSSRMFPASASVSSSSSATTTAPTTATATATATHAAPIPATELIPKKERKQKKPKGKKRKGVDLDDSDKKPGPRKGKKKKDKQRHDDKDGRSTLPTTPHETRKKKKRSAAHAAVQDMMRNFLEEDKYSNQGSIVHLDPTQEEESDAVRTIWAVTPSTSSGRKLQLEIQPLRLDRFAIATAMRKRMRMELVKSTSGGILDRTNVASAAAFGKARGNSVVIEEFGGRVAADGLDEDGLGRKKKRKKQKRGKPSSLVDLDPLDNGLMKDSNCTIIRSSTSRDETDLEEGGFKDESSIFGQTQGSSHATWVQCDKCKKWRRLRGVVDSKKLPQKWYCSMNRRDPERAKCSAPEEEYDGTQTPESITDQRARKHLRLWVRRLKCNESYEAHRPTLTRTKKKEFDAKAPYEWVRCCNPSCGKWRAILKSMDASSIIDAAKNGEWYCVMNTWDEKTASCAAPQENLPAIGCPPWVQQNKDPFDFPSI